MTEDSMDCVAIDYTIGSPVDGSLRAVRVTYEFTGWTVLASRYVEGKPAEHWQTSEVAALGHIRRHDAWIKARTNAHQGARTMAKQAWTHKVVKMSRGVDGKWFAFRAAGTFADAESAIGYAREFASEQRVAGVSGTRIAVVSRKGAREVFSANVNRGDLPADRANASVTYA